MLCIVAAQLNAGAFLFLPKHAKGFRGINMLALCRIFQSKQNLKLGIWLGDDFSGLSLKAALEKMI